MTVQALLAKFPELAAALPVSCLCGKEAVPARTYRTDDFVGIECERCVCGRGSVRVGITRTAQSKAKWKKMVTDVCESLDSEIKLSH